FFINDYKKAFTMYKEQLKMKTTFLFGTSHFENASQGDHNDRQSSLSNRNSFSTNKSNNRTDGINGRVTNINNPNNSKLCPNPPSKAISSLRFNPCHEILAVGCWDNSVCCYGYSNTGDIKPLTKQSTNNPVLDIAWGANGQMLFSACCDCTVYAWMPQQNVSAVIGKHKAPVRCVEVVDSGNNNTIVSGSWDNTVIFWDANNKKAIQTLNMNAKVYCMSSRGNVLAVGLANKYVNCYDLRKLSQPVQSKPSMLLSQLRSLDVLPTGDGYAAASVEGRTSLEYFNNPYAFVCFFFMFVSCNSYLIQKIMTNSFTFKCHRQDLRNDVHIYSVNVLRFHPSGALTSGGSDGGIFIWDTKNRSRIKAFTRLRLPIVALDFDRSGQKLAYATSYDWSQGLTKWNENLQKPQIFLHTLKKEDVIVEK
ncbi:hypothetical protein RFI_00105, partial [Reticulomyxa filosa]